MHPDLVARIEASVSGRRPKHSKDKKKLARRGIAPGYVSMARFGFVLIAVVLGYLVSASKKREKKDQNTVRTELLEMHKKHASQLTDTDKTFNARAESALIRLSRSHDEIITDDVKTADAFAATLTRPLVYVRGPIGMFATPRGIGETSQSSTKDAFLLCLLSPPESRVEKTMLPKMRVAYGSGGGAPLEAATPNVRRLWDSAAGLPYLQPAYKDRLEKTDDSTELLKIRRELERAPLERAVQAAKSQLLLAVMDEPGTGTGPTELDGERQHWVRVILYDLKADKALLSTRRLVDPSWISLAKKSEYALGLDSCQLAFDVHESLRNPTKK